jgi:hypothetical protein
VPIPNQKQSQKSQPVYYKVTYFPKTFEQPPVLFHLTTMQNDPITIEGMRTMILDYLQKNDMTEEKEPKPLLAVIGENKIEQIPDLTFYPEHLSKGYDIVAF